LLSWLRRSRTIWISWIFPWIWKALRNSSSDIAFGMSKKSRLNGGSSTSAVLLNKLANCWRLFLDDDFLFDERCWSSDETSRLRFRLSIMKSVVFFGSITAYWHFLVLVDYWVTIGKYRFDILSNDFIWIV
jgi:hypothetical protein